MLGAAKTRSRRRWWTPSWPPLPRTPSSSTRSRGSAHSPTSADRTVRWTTFSSSPAKARVADDPRRQRRRRAPNTPGKLRRRAHRGGSPMKPSRPVTSGGVRGHTVRVHEEDRQGRPARAQQPHSRPDMAVWRTRCHRLSEVRLGQRRRHSNRAGQAPRP